MYLCVCVGGRVFVQIHTNLYMYNTYHTRHWMVERIRFVNTYTLTWFGFEHNIYVRGVPPDTKSSYHTRIKRESPVFVIKNQINQPIVSERDSKLYVVCGCTWGNTFSNHVTTVAHSRRLESIPATYGIKPIWFVQREYYGFWFL